ncbi:hypothetical protein MAIT1_04559 [Magnetofaba australis IT-1]|uniref:Uncharacterized protein n=1 Tax=Magnetofaba australis IT-1 TaxID=1434232 RepID=A0A1Y2KCD2_9PROT|nr:hypothetical protein MAIT1_04559 [Magnetofaba australis IT-1]
MGLGIVLQGSDEVVGLFQQPTGEFGGPGDGPGRRACADRNGQRFARPGPAQTAGLLQGHEVIQHPDRRLQVVLARRLDADALAHPAGADGEAFRQPPAHLVLGVFGGAGQGHGGGEADLLFQVIGDCPGLPVIGFDGDHDLSWLSGVAAALGKPALLTLIATTAEDHREGSAFLADPLGFGLAVLLGLVRCGLAVVFGAGRFRMIDDAEHQHVPLQAVADLGHEAGDVAALGPETAIGVEHRAQFLHQKGGFALVPEDGGDDPGQGHHPREVGHALGVDEDLHQPGLAVRHGVVDGDVDGVIGIGRLDLVGGSVQDLGALERNGWLLLLHDLAPDDGLVDSNRGVAHGVVPSESGHEKARLGDPRAGFGGACAHASNFDVDPTPIPAKGSNRAETVRMKVFAAVFPGW